MEKTKRQKNREVIIFKSFEQFKTEIFPNLVREEKMESIKNDSKKLGICLAEQAIDRILQKKNLKNKNFTNQLINCSLM